MDIDEFLNNISDLTKDYGAKNIEFTMDGDTKFKYPIVEFNVVHELEPNSKNKIRIVLGEGEC
jgi:hypothetical protein